MKTQSTSLSALLALAFLSCAAGIGSAQFAIPRFTADSGGGGSTGGAFRLGGTAGQADAGRLTGASFALAGGFWAGGGGVVSSVPGDEEIGVDPTAPAPLAFHLYPTSPNPVRESMVVAFDLPDARFVRAEVYDAAGRLVRVLASEVLAAGRNQRAWDRRDGRGARVSAGIYFIRFDAGRDQSRQKIVVVS